jgi:uncharacterized membrane protein
MVSTVAMLVDKSPLLLMWVTGVLPGIYSDHINSKGGLSTSMATVDTREDTSDPHQQQGNPIY